MTHNRISTSIMAGAMALAISMGAISCSHPSNINSRIHLLKEETIPLRMKLYTNDNSQMVLAGKFFDLDGNVVGRLETPFSNNGPLSLHFTDVDINGKHIIFPYAISFEGNDQEIDLYEYYTTDGFPDVYRSHFIDSTLRVEIGNLFELLVEGKEGKVNKHYGEVSYLSSDIEHPREGVGYEFHIASSGRIYFLKTN